MTGMPPVKVSQHEIQVERVLIGILLRSSLSLDNLVELAPGISEEWFVDEAHRKAFSAMMKLAFESGRNSWDASVVAIATGSAVDVGYLVELQTMAPHPSKLETVAAEMREQVTVRRFRLLGGQIANWQGSGEELIRVAQRGFIAEIDAAVGAGLEDMDTQIRLWNDEVEKERAVGSKNIVYSGYTDIDRRIGGFRPGEVYYVAGRPGTGKTAFALNIVMHAARQGHRAAVFSLEMLRRQMISRLLCIAECYMSDTPDEVLLDSNIIRSIAEIDANRARGLLSRISEIQAWMKGLPIYTDYSSRLSSAEIHAKARRMKRQNGLNLIVVDYVQLMSDSGGRSRTEEIGLMTKGLKMMAKDLEVPVIALAQMNRGIEARSGDSRPVMSDLREGGSIENDADYVGFLYEHDSQEHGSGIMELISRKVRSSATGTDLLKAKLANFRFMEPDPWERRDYQSKLASGSKKGRSDEVQMT